MQTERRTRDWMTGRRRDDPVLVTTSPSTETVPNAGPEWELAPRGHLPGAPAQTSARRDAQLRRGLAVAIDSQISQRGLAQAGRVLGEDEVAHDRVELFAHVEAPAAADLAQLEAAARRRGARAVVDAVEVGHERLDELRCPIGGAADRGDQAMKTMWAVAGMLAVVLGGAGPAPY